MEPGYDPWDYVDDALDNGDDPDAPGDCPGCGAEYPYCDCGRDDAEEAESRDGWQTAMELIESRFHGES